MHIFDNIEDAKFRLSNHAKDFKFPIRDNLKTKKDIIKYSVGSNIFRALGVDNHKPSEIYRNWADINFDFLYSQLSCCQNQRDFDEIIKYFSNSLLIGWSDATNSKLVYGPASKMVNLLIKAIQETNQFKLENVISFQHVPWDAYTLRPLRNIINELSTVNYRIKIPVSATMSFINSEELYEILQRAICNLYQMIDNQPPVICFDYFAWNNNH